MRRLLYALFALASLSGPAWAEEPVCFGDEKLKAAVEAQLWVSDPTPSDLLALTSLNVGYEGITSLIGLEYAGNLRSLIVNWNRIRDVSPLAGLTNLEELVIHANPLDGVDALSGLSNLRLLDIRSTGISDLSFVCGLQNLRELDATRNGVTDLSPLSRLHDLQRVWLDGNEIDDISVLSELTGLRDLSLSDNYVSDISPLLGLMNLESLDLSGNPLDGLACASYIPQILANNPCISILHDSCVQRLTVSSTVGGRVIRPGEGEFLYDGGQVVTLEVQADPGFVFVGWSGDSCATDLILPVTMSRDRTLRAHFRSTSDTLYVADRTSAESSAAGAEDGDSLEDGTREHSLGQIQQAIEVAAEGSSILVAPGVYREKIDFLGKSVRLIGIEPDDPADVAWPVLDGEGAGTVVSFTRGEDPNALLRGFVITRGGSSSAGAIACVGSSPTITDCLIVGNRATDATGAAVYCADSHATFVNCTIADNYAGRAGAGVCLDDSSVTLTNSILWGNTPGEIRLMGASELSIRYCDVAGGWTGPGNIDADPLFARAGYWVDGEDPGVVVGVSYVGARWVLGDNHLLSQAGRWDPGIGSWVQDSVTSPCIDAGDPATGVGMEPSPSGGIIDMGAYGGTPQASKSR